MNSRFGSQPVWMIIDRQHLTISEVARRIGLPRSVVTVAVNGGARPHPVVIVRLCDCLGIKPEEAFTPAVLAKPSRRRTIPRVMWDNDYRPELDTKWVPFLESMGWPPRAVRAHHNEFAEGESMDMD